MNAVLVISARDNVATALEALDAGRSISAGGTHLVVAEPIPRGHKVALRAIHEGEPVIKYGSPIGTASYEIAPGTHVHTHNVASARGRGDLGAPAPRPSDAPVASGVSRTSEPVASGFSRTSESVRPTAEPIE